ncbi:hypothetical protein [Pseudofrankia sp. BMG5.37]|uniref:hypothetical protein n=1 Tax=Pseudofrankia sp. BMG5.37 TaxID=3050035 RepID=UPI002894C7B6|nr:hypothetical protein [Pseudofrankia sp. BMG5.37]MDT3442303.1 hypothetical protein [Pseudofrankia sp. BMG5.37]
MTLPFQATRRDPRMDARPATWTEEIQTEPMARAHETHHAVERPAGAERLAEPGRAAEPWYTAESVPRRPVAREASATTVRTRLWGAALVAGFAVIAAIQPGPEARPPTQPAWADVAAAVSLGLLAVAVTALLAGRRWGLGPATYGGAGLVALCALCPAWQHHQVGGWWVAQSLISTVMLGGSVALRARPDGAATRRVSVAGAGR